MKLKTVILDGKNYIVLPYPFAEMIFTKAYNALKDKEAKDKLSNIALRLFRISQDKGYYKEGNIVCLAEIFSWIKITIDGSAQQEEFIF